jgi:hypothetical protein
MRCLDLASARSSVSLSGVELASLSFFLAHFFFFGRCLMLVCEMSSFSTCFLSISISTRELPFLFLVGKGSSCCRVPSFSVHAVMGNGLTLIAGFFFVPFPSAALLVRSILPPFFSGL